MKLLIVDDMKSFLDLEKSFLSRAECQVLTASTGLEALKVAQAEIPDLIVLDVEMPEMNGIEATRILSSRAELKDIPIVILSSTTREQESLAAGARQFVKKPVDEERFLEIIRAYVPLTVRKDVRRLLNRPCVYQKEGFRGEATVVDISISGLFLQGAADLAIGDRLNILFTFPLEGGTKEIQAEGMVVRFTPHGCGVRFSDISQGAKLFIQEFAGG